LARTQVALKFSSLLSDETVSLVLPLLSVM
jgi:hypothetical protein